MPDVVADAGRSVESMDSDSQSTASTRDGTHVASQDSQDLVGIYSQSHSFSAPTVQDMESAPCCLVDNYHIPPKQNQGDAAPISRGHVLSIASSQLISSQVSTQVDSSQSSQEWGGKGGGGMLTPEQLERVERNRAAALARRRERELREREAGGGLAPEGECD